MVHELPRSAHTSHAWRIHEVATDFRVESVWSVRTPGAGPRDFHAVLDAVLAPGGSGTASPGGPAPLQILLGARRVIGRLLRWDDAERDAGTHGLLLDRLPSELRNESASLRPGFAGMTTLYELDDECAFELVNRTVYGAMHLGWVPVGAGEYELRMTELTQPRGHLGRLYMAAIALPRRFVAVPALLRY